MEKKHILLLIFSFFVLNPIAGANDDCLPASCSSSDPEIRFPFRILGQQPDRCGFPGFDLSCDGQNQTILQLSSSLSYIVNSISYLEQVIYIDPEFCRPNRIVSVNVTETPFSYSNFFMQSYTFYNCSQNYSSMYPDVPFPCLSSGNHSVIAMLTGSVYPGYVPPNCKVMKSVVLPVRPNGDISVALELMWFTPYCKTCEREGKACELKTDDEQTICVSSRRKGISRSAKYGLGIGMSVLALICISGLACYVSSKVQGHNDSHNQSIDTSPVANIPQQPNSGTGLDGRTIESYPKTVFGESSQSPNVDATCVICLFDYKLKESLRTIPQCNHCFHAECIDEWLKLNKTCLVCAGTHRKVRHWLHLAVKHY
ncbi:hypothetical protein L2E82_06508 [Cichorium intybus]|uniref:Uncharacterized protein n=1 Tax=Cichorium intybus TaxID=13427 RepID=A0ACB9H9R9_CICIN|nr:hypothetical protein L2E82_06508 [Cichorium intybus]